MPMTIEEFKAIFLKFISKGSGGDEEDELDAGLRLGIMDALEALRIAERRLARLGSALSRGDSQLGREIAAASQFVELLAPQKRSFQKAVATEDAGQIAIAARAFSTWLAGDAIVAVIDAPNPHRIALGLRGGLKDAMDRLASLATRSEA